MHTLANPRRFRKISDAVLPWLLWSCAIMTPILLYWALVRAPEDYQQGDAFRIIFVHVPAAWAAMMGYAIVGIASITALIWRHPLASIAGRAAAPIGATFTAIALFTGSVWGKPMWGTWWVWDARLTSVLILFFLYLGYMALHDAFDDKNRGAKAAEILAIVGLVNLPIIKFSVDWWNTLHQPASIVRLDGPTVHPSMLYPLLLMILLSKLYFVAVMLLRMRSIEAQQRIENIEQRSLAD